MIVGGPAMGAAGHAVVVEAPGRLGDWTAPPASPPGA
jgi:hypothetical protein